MRTRTKVAFLFVTMIAAFGFTISPAFAHRFNVALVVPLSGAALVQGRQIREGFMLATTERDSHPDQESDGHLGGLDVYVTVLDEQGDVAAEIARMATQGEVDIVAALGSARTLSQIKKLLAGKEIALLVPGRTPFSNSGSPSAAAFISAYQSANGGRPSSHAAQGYNAARRIDLAVRAEGGVDDTASLLLGFRETERGFNW
jgi:ABC-type branched-subunit amino acid transport system substrate-binding protein